MKKSRKASSGRSSSKRPSSSKRSSSKPFRSSSSSKSSSIFRKKPRESSRSKEESRQSSGSSLKDKIRRKKAAAGFSKPSRSPGEKIRPEAYGESETYADNTDMENQSGGRGCCGSIGGIITLIIVLGFVALMVFVFKCF